MNTIFIHQIKESDPDAVAMACRILHDGGIVLYPTDTIYGLGVDAAQASAMEKLCAFKGRPQGKELSVMVSGVEMAQEYVEIDEKHRSS